MALLNIQDIAPKFSVINQDGVLITLDQFKGKHGPLGGAVRETNKLSKSWLSGVCLEAILGRAAPPC